MEDETRGVDATNTATGGSDGGVGGGAAVGGSGVDGDGGGGSSSRVPATSIASDFAMEDVRQRYTVELKPGETTIVSWKKLVKDARKSNGPPPPLLPAAVAPPGAHPALNSRVDPGQSVGEANDAPAPNRYSAVIEKIERLYMGNQSSEEEELDDTPDDDQYDTEDSFIDDADLDEYFQVDKSTTKHTGFFVNRGKLESTNEPEPEPEPNQQPRKRRRKDSKNACGEENGEHVPNKHSKLVDSRMKATMEIVPLAGSKSSIASHSVAATGKHNENGKSQNRNVPMVHKVKKSAVPSNALVRDAPLALREENDTEKQKVGLTHLRDSSDKLKVASEPSDATHQTSMKVHHREKNGSSEVLNLSAGKHPPKSVDISPMHAKDSPSVRPKGTMLERAMRDLEKIVAESRPPSTEVQDSTDPSFQAVKRRLPREVKQKLAKVARLAQSSQGKIPDELIRRLMGILGHIVQLRTLKRNLKEMVELGLSAKQEKDKKCQQIKEEVIEMIKKRGPWLNPKASEQHDGTSDNFKDGVSSKGKGLHGGKSGMDNVMEEKICEIYDLYVEDEDRLPRIRKLYMELAELWPNGYMDNHGIKNAVNRAKERKRALQGQRKEQEKIKRKKLSPSLKREDTFFGEAKSVAQLRFAQERVVKDGNRVLTPPSRMTSSHTLPKQHLSPSGRASNTSISGSSLDRPKQDKIKVNTSAFLEDARKTMDGTLLTKKLKRKSGSDVGDIHSRPEKIPLQQGKERLKPSNHRISSHSNRPNDHSADFLSREQPS